MSTRKVKYIDDSNYSAEHLKWIKTFPVLNDVYTIRQRTATGNGQIGYILHEIENPLMPNGIEPGFNSKRFIVLGKDEFLKNLVNQKEELETV